MNNVKLVLGTMTFGESVFRPQTDAFIDAFLDAGYDEMDTAYVYNDGTCERMLGEILPKLDRPYRIATKVNPRITGKLDADAAYMQIGESLKRLDLESFDTSLVTLMKDMFLGCTSLTKLNLSSFETSNVTDMGYMFKDCESLKNLDLSNFDMRNVSGDYCTCQMFHNCPAGSQWQHLLK
jgi:surface protein